MVSICDAGGNRKLDVPFGSLFFLFVDWFWWQAACFHLIFTGAGRKNVPKGNH